MSEPRAFETLEEALEFLSKGPVPPVQCLHSERLAVAVYGNPLLQSKCALCGRFTNLTPNHPLDRW